MEAPTEGEGQAPGLEEMDGELTAAPTPEQPEPGVHFVTTAPTLKLLNHHPLLEEFLQEGQEKDELRPDPPTASPLPRLANQDSRPVFTSPTQWSLLPSSSLKVELRLLRVKLGSRADVL